MSRLGLKQISNSIYYSEDINSLHFKPSKDYPSFIVTISNSYIFDDGTIVILYGYYYGDDDLSAGYTFGFSAGYMDSNLYKNYKKDIFDDDSLPLPNDIHIMITSANEIESKLEDHTLNFDTFKVNSLSSAFSELLNEKYTISPSSIIIEPDYSSNKINIVFSAYYEQLEVTHYSEGDTFISHTGKYTFLFGKLIYDIKSNTFSNVEKISFSNYNYGSGDIEIFSNPILVKLGNKYRLFNGVSINFEKVDELLTINSYKKYLYIDVSFSENSHSFGGFLPKYNNNNNVVYTSDILYDEKRKSLIIPGFELDSGYSNDNWGHIPPQPLYMYEVNPITFDVIKKSSNNIHIDMNILGMDSPMPDWKDKTLIAFDRLIFTSFSEIYDRKTLFAITLIIYNAFTTNYAALFDLDSFSFVENSFIDVTPFCKSVNDYGPNYLHSTIASDGKFILISESYHYGGE